MPLGRERCFTTVVVFELLGEAQWQGTDRDRTALPVLTPRAELDLAPNATRCPWQLTDSPLTPPGLAGTAEPPTSCETPGRAGLFSEPLAWTMNCISFIYKNSIFVVRVG